jgi:hypothetical protein
MILDKKQKDDDFVRLENKKKEVIKQFTALQIERMLRNTSKKLALVFIAINILGSHFMSDRFLKRCPFRNHEICIETESPWIENSELEQ